MTLNSETEIVNANTMTSPKYRVRRATLDDLDTLRPLWESMRFPAATLEKRLTEFQVAEDSDGKLVGAIGFLMTGRHGQIHSETYSDFGVSDLVRPLFRDRLQVLATNHGILRVWTREEAPFWKQNGLQPATSETLKKLPSQWEGAAEGWLTLQLKNEEAIASVEKEVSLLMMTEKQRTAKVVGQATRFRKALIVIAFVIVIAILGLAVYAYIRHKQYGIPQ
jgi:N-acetylglutamate synthase-like GNAT family acetyltransferase